VGVWTAEVYQTKIITESFKEGFGEDADEALQYFRFRNYTLIYILTFYKDGTYTQQVSEGYLTSMIDGIRMDIITGLKSYYKELFKSMGLNGSVDEILKKAIGKTVGDLVDMNIMKNIKSDITELAKGKEGRYKAEDGKLYFSDSKDSVPDENYYDTYELTGNYLILQECFCPIDEAEKEYNDMMYPMVFERYSGA
jgi:hypothetical protein